MNKKDVAFAVSKIDIAVKALSEISKRGTCWECKHYIGNPVGAYCNPKKPCNRKTWDQYEPTDKNKIISRNALNEMLE